MKYDIVIIGAGPAGLMTACQLDAGQKVLIVAKNHKPGLKLLTTGGGRCNITNLIEDYKELSKCYDQSGKFLMSALSRFGAKEAVDFFNELGVKTKIEKNQQVYPISDRATEVQGALLSKLHRLGIEVRTETVVKKLNCSGQKIKNIVLDNGEIIEADFFVIATGGKSYPSTGSTGDAYQWLKEMGHQITKLKPALVPIIISEKYLQDIEGLSFAQASLTLKQADKKVATVQDDIIITARGLSGPGAHNISRLAVNLPSGKLSLSINILNISAEILDKKLQIILASNKKLGNCLAELVPNRFINILCELAEVDSNKTSNLVSRSERQSLVNNLTDWQLSIKAWGGFDQAIVTAGGVDLHEVDPKTMKSKVIDNLYLVGEVLDLDGPSGGYNLQICWSTGYCAGKAINLKFKI